MYSRHRSVALWLVLALLLSSCARDGGQTGDEGSPGDGGPHGDLFEQLAGASQANYQPATSLRELAMASDAIILGRAMRVERGRVFIGTSSDGSVVTRIETLVLHLRVIDALKGAPGATLYLEFIVGNAEAFVASTVPDNRVFVFARPAQGEPLTTGGTIEHAGRGLPGGATLRTLTTPQGFAMETEDGGVVATFERDDALLARSSFYSLLNAILEALQPIEDAGADRASSTDASSTDASSTDTNASDAGDTSPLITFLEPTVFDLPINSVRHAVSGYDAATDLCISLIWYVDTFEETRFCELGDTLETYVWIEAGASPGCWDYAGNAELLAQRGCADFGELTEPADDAIDVAVDVTSDLFTGTVHFKTP